MAPGGAAGGRIIRHLELVLVVAALIFAAGPLLVLPAEAALEHGSIGPLAARGGEVVPVTPAAASPLLATIATIPTGSWRGISPGSPAFDSLDGYVYVPQFYSSSVTIVEGTQVIGSVPVSGNATGAIFDAFTGLVYVTAANSSEVDVISTTSVVAEVPVENCVAGAAVDSTNGHVYVTEPCNGNVTIINSTTVLSTVHLPGANATDRLGGIAFDPTNGFVYVSDPASGDLYVLNGTALDTTMSLGGDITEGTFDAATGLLYVTDASNGSLDVVRNTTLVGVVGFGGPEYGAGFAYPATYDSGNGLLYVSYQGFDQTNASLAVINGTTDLASLNVGSLLAGTATYGAYANGSGFVYETTSESENGGVGAGTLSAITGSTVAGNVSFPSEPTGSVYDDQNGLVYLPTYTPDNLTTGLSTAAIVVVDCSVCRGVVVTESGVLSGASWSVTASNGSASFAVQVASIAPAPIGLHLLAGTYTLTVSGPAGISISVSSANATYSSATGKLTVSPSISVPPGSSSSPHSYPQWIFDALVAAAAVTVLAGTAVLRHQRIRREGERLVREIEAVVQPTVSTEGGAPDEGRAAR